MGILDRIHAAPLAAARDLPLLIRPAAGGPRPEMLSEWLDGIREDAAWVGQRLLEHGGILFRGFPLQTAEDFHRLVASFDRAPRSYTGGNSPRERVSEGVYTSTSYAHTESISLHNEMSYASEWPAQIFFFCLTPPDDRGETPIADGRRILQRIDPSIRERFERKGVMYVRNLHGGSALGRSWQQTFETEDRAEVETFCRTAGIQWDWREDGSLRTQEVRPAVATHPITGETVWFNQAEQWHASSLDPKTRALLARIMGDEDLPHNAYYGDGTPIEPADLDRIREALDQEAVVFPWMRGDVLMLDNMLTAHGRRPYKGQRTILVSMT